MSEPKRRRAANGQRVNRDAVTWYWECDHAHDTSNGEVPWWGNEPTQGEAYAVLDRHNAAHHPHIVERSGA